MKRFFATLVALCLLLAGCAPSPAETSQLTWLDLFDTVTTVMGSGDDFPQKAQSIHDELMRYHRLFNIYNTYEGLNNLKTVNDQAGIAPVQVDEDILRLLQDCKTYYDLTGGKVNVALGSVLSLWHEARTAALDDPENAKLPDSEALLYAARHTDIDSVIIDEETGTVYISDPEVSLDVGAIAKGWAVQQVAETAPEGLLISVGGNVVATGAKAENTPWSIGIQDPIGSGYLHAIPLTGGAVVTSGNYQRTFTVAGKAYHHIIDPATCMPPELWSGVTAVCPDSGLADALSTALFLLPLEEGKALAQRCGAEALWIDGNGAEYMTDGFSALIQQ